MTVFATLRNQDDMSLLPCEFNPSSVKLTKSATWSTPPARNAKAHPRPQFVGTGPQTLSLSLLFNAYGRDGSPIALPVALAVQKLLDWTQPTQRSQEAHNPAPPTIEFYWGAQVTMTGFLKNVEIDYLLFDNDGTPLRATANVTLQALPQTTPGTNPTSGGISGRRSAQTNRATRSPRSRNANTATRGCGGRSPSRTTSMIRAGCLREQDFCYPRARRQSRSRPWEATPDEPFRLRHKAAHHGGRHRAPLGD